jgi:hypothetical protein
MASNKFRQLIAEAVEAEIPVDETLYKIIRLITGEPECNFRQHFLLENFNSQKIVKLLAYLENESPKIRKLALLFFALIVANPKSKMYFLEKCGFGMSFGKMLFTRLKYLQNSIPRGLEATSVVRSFILTVNAAKRPNRAVLFWFVPLSSLEDSNLKVVNFFESVFENKLSMELLMEVLPDPTENMCGFEFSQWDLPEPTVNPSLLMSEPPLPKPSSSFEDLNARPKVKSGKMRMATDKSEEFNSNMGKSMDGTSPANKSIGRKGKQTPLDVFQKYRSSIKDRTPSLNAKKEAKSSSIVAPKRVEASPVRGAKATPADPKSDPKSDNKSDNKNAKSQKINDILQRAKVSKSPTNGENRGNMSERLSKILGPRTKA